MGVVYRAHDPQIDREVALKVLRRDRITGEEFVSRFLKEARVIGRLSHPNIVTVYDVGQEEPDLYIAMEFIEGSPLNDLLRVISLSIERIVEIGIQTAQTLDYAHQKGVVHRDIKPSNILLKPDKNIIITDFGIAHIQGATDTLQTREGEIMGTPAYMSPEQVLGKIVDGRADIFSLGAVLYELTTGIRPFGGANSNIAAVFNAIMNQDPDEPAAMTDAVGKDLSAVIMKCLRKDPAERYQAGNELAQALKDSLAKLEAGTPEEPPLKEEKAGKQASKKNYVIAAVTAAVFVMLLSAGIYFYFQPKGVSPSGTPAIQEPTVSTPAPSSAKAPEEKKPEPAAPSPSPAVPPAPLPAPAAVSPVDKPAAKTQKAEHKSPKQEEKKSSTSVMSEPQPQKSTVKKQANAAKDGTAAMVLTAVTILSNPRGANVYIDEKSKGKTPLTQMLSVGKHNLRISLPGYRDVRQVVTIEETMEYPLAFQLKSASESD